MRKLLLIAALCLFPSLAWAQNPTCPNRPSGDSSNACANTRFVKGAIGTAPVTIAKVAHQWLDSYTSTTGIFTQSQPAFTDISGNINVNQMNSGTGAASSTIWRGDATWANSISGPWSILSATAPPAGGTAGNGYLFSSTANFGTFFGSGSPTLSAAAGSMYYRSDCSSVSTCAYVNTNGSTAWSALGSGGGSGCSVTGSQFQIIVVDATGSACAADANASANAGALSLGASGTAGSVKMGNATTGTVTLQPVTGALGSVTASLPANTGTIAELNLAQTWSANQTYGSGNLQMNGVTGFTHSDSTNGTITDLISNANSGSSALAALEFTNNSGNTFFQLYGGNNTNGVSGAGSEFEISSAIGSLSLFTTGGEIVFVAQPTIATSGVFPPQNYYLSQSTTTFTGTTTVSAFSQTHIGRPTLTDSSAATLTTANTVLIDNSPNCTGSLTCTNVWALNVAAGATNLAGATTIGGALTYGGVTLSNSVTGTGSMALSVSPTFTGTISGASETLTGTLTVAEVIGNGRTASGTTDTLAATDCGQQVNYTSSSAVTVTIPATLPLWCNISILQAGTAKVSVNGSAVTPATLHSAHSYTGTSAQWAMIGINIEANSGGSSAVAILTGDGS